MIVSIHQPNYLPWMGLMHKILESDIFIVLDDVQFVRGKNFVTRSQIKTSGGPKWITIPVHNKNNFLPINQIKINNDIPWKDEHWNKIEQNYNKSKFFSDYSTLLKNSIYRVVMGEMNPGLKGLKLELNAREVAILAPLAFLAVCLGLYPEFVLSYLDAPVKELLLAIGASP